MFSNPAGSSSSLALQHSYRYVKRRWRILFAVIDYLGGLLFRAGRLISRHPSAPSMSSDDTPNQILVLQLDHLGDAILSLPMLRMLRAQYPTACIDILCDEWNREWFESLPEIDHVQIVAYRFAREKPRRVVHWLPRFLLAACRLRRRHYDLAIDVRGDFPIALFMWLTGARRRIGWDCGGGGFLLTHSAIYVPHRPERASRLSLLRALGVSENEAPASHPYDPGSEARAVIRSRLKALRISDRSLVVFHIGAGTEAKRWPAQHWCDLTTRLLIEQNVEIVLVGNNADRSLARTICEAVAAEPHHCFVDGSRGEPQCASIAWHLHDWTGSLSIRELAAIIARATLFVGADSGPAHLAAAVDTRGIVLFSGANYVNQWRPRGAEVQILDHEVACAGCHQPRCPQAEHFCMVGLHPGRVLELIDTMLNDGAQTISHDSNYPRPVYSLDGAATTRRLPVLLARQEECGHE